MASTVADTDIKLKIEQGFREALADKLYQLGMQYRAGRGVPQDVQPAVVLFALAAKQGCANAQYELGYCYEKGEGVPQDHRHAARLYQQAADQGHISAQLYLSNCYRSGRGVPQELRIAENLRINVDTACDKIRTLLS